MAVTNQAIPSLFNGVSQQPAALRLPSQCEVMDNFYPTLAEGLVKRPATVLKARLGDPGDQNAFLAVINRDATERYQLLIRDGDLKVFDLSTGTEKAVAFPNGKAYLVSSNPRSSFAAVSVADHTFIVNKGVTVQPSPTVTAPSNPNIGFVHFTYNGTSASRTLTVTIPGLTTASATATYNDGTYTKLGNLISSIHDQLSTALVPLGWAITMPHSHLIRIEAPAATDWNLEVSDDYGATCMKAIKGSVQLFSDLPAQLDDGYVCYVATRPEDQGRGYYVRWDAASKSYIECPKPGLKTDLLASTMPHKLVRNADGSFTFEPFQWASRKVGDDKSNPWPTFVGRTISDVFMWRKRLGFLSDENVCASRADDYFSFSVKSATAVVDNDPLDVPVGNTQVSLLRFAVPFNKSLLLFSDQAQYQLSGGDVLSPKTVRADPATEFLCSPKARPVGIGQELFFVTEGPSHAAIREYYVEDNSVANDAADTTAHVQRYIPRGVFKMAASTSEDCLLVLTEEQRNVIYAYKFYWGADEKVQSAWFRFVFDSDDTILGADFVGATAYLVIQRSTGIYLEEMSLQSGVVDEGLHVSSLLDRKVTLQGTFNADTGRTTWSLPYAHSGSVFAVLGPAFGASRSSFFPLRMDSAFVGSAEGDWTAGPCYVGCSYTARFRFSEQYVRDAKGNVMAAARVKIRRMLVSFVSSAYFRVEVTPKARQTSSTTYTGKVLGVSGSTVGVPELSSGKLSVPVMADSSGVSIDIINDSPMPSTFQGAEWIGEVVMGAQR